MTNIVEIIDKLNKEGYRIDVAIVDGRLYIIYKNKSYDITHVSFARAILLVSDIMYNEIREHAIKIR